MSNTPSTTFAPWINGDADVSLSPRDRGLAFGDGVFETVRVTEAGPVLFDYHWQRIMHGLERLGIVLNAGLLRHELTTYPGFTHPGVIKIIVTRGEGVGGYQVPKDSEPTRIISHSPAPEYPVQFSHEGVAVYPCKTQLGINAHLAGIKHLNRLEQVLARNEWKETQYQEGLLCDQLGNPVEATARNIFIIKDKKVLTPQLDHCGVKGCMRRWLLETFCEQGFDALETSFTMAQLIQCDEWFLCNSVAGIWPVRQFQEHSWTVGEVTHWALSQVREHWLL